MCKFFSFVTKGSNKYYFDWNMRKELLKSNPNELTPDSHTSICKVFNLNDDKVNKYEYNPLTKFFETDQINIKDNQALAKKWVEKLDFQMVIEPLIIKPIIHPFKIHPPEITDKHIELLKSWNSVRDSVGDSVGASVRASVGDSVGYSVGAYISSFYIIEKWKYIDHEPFKNPFQSCIDLWGMGLVPSYNGTIWRLHGGEQGKVLFEINS